MHAELRLGYGIRVGHNAVAMLMRRAGLQGLSGSRGPRRRRITPLDTPADLVDRNFARHEPDQLWVTDVTEHPTREGKVYCAVVLDVFSRRVVGWSIDRSATAGLVTSALGMAIGNRQPDPETVIHSDQGTPFTSWAFTDRARQSGLVPSMGSVGDYRQFSRLRDRYLPDPRALDHTDRLARLTEIRAYVRRPMLRQDADLDWTEIGAKVKQLVDERISADVRELTRIVEVLQSFPVLLLGLAMFAAFGSLEIFGPVDHGMAVLVLSISMVNFPLYLRQVRSVLLPLTEAEFVQAAKCAGLGAWGIVWHHFIPNARGQILALFPLTCAYAIQIIAGLSFIGLGIEPPNPEWGSRSRQGPRSSSRATGGSPSSPAPSSSCPCTR